MPLPRQVLHAGEIVVLVGVLAEWCDYRRWEYIYVNTVLVLHTVPGICIPEVSNIELLNHRIL